MEHLLQEPGLCYQVHNKALNMGASFIWLNF